MSGLEEVGVPGPDHLREALTNCTDPLAAIEEFQARITVLYQTTGGKSIKCESAKTRKREQ